MVADALLLVAAITACLVYIAMAVLGGRRERELAEARAHEERLRSLTELSADWFWETDAEHRITWLSGGGPVATLFGDTPTYGKRFWEIDLARLGVYLDQTLVSHIITARCLAPLMVEADRGLIVEVIDGHDPGYRGHILYDLTKASLARLAYGMAMELARTGVTALSVSPGFLRSEAVLEHLGVREGNWRDAIAKDPYFAQSETPALVGRGVAALAADPEVRRKAGLVHFAADLAREYGFADVDGRTPDFPKMFDAEVEALASAPPLDERGRFLVWARYCQIHQDPARHDLAVLLARALGFETLGPGLGPAKART